MVQGGRSPWTFPFTGDDPGVPGQGPGRYRSKPNELLVSAKLGVEGSCRNRTDYQCVVRVSCHWTTDPATPRFELPWRGLGGVDVSVAAIETGDTTRRAPTLHLHQALPGRQP